MIRFIVAVPLFLFACAAQATGWQKADGSSLGFRGTYQGEAFEGRFERFTPSVEFDPAALADARIEVEVDMTSAKTGVADYDSTMQDSAFFDGARFPTARFVAQSFRKTGENAYEADAELTIRDKTVPIVFRFRFVAEGEGARLTSALTLKRLDFDVGTGDWADTALIANDVDVKVDLPLIRSP